MLESQRRLHISHSAVEEMYIYRPNLRESFTVSFNGLLRYQKAACYPDYDFQRARDLAGPIPKHLKKKTGLKRPWHGQARGKAGHLQIQTIVNAGEEAAASLFIGAGRLPQADAYLRSLPGKNLKSITSEFIDYYEQHGVATGIDHLCITTSENRHGKHLLVPVEIKFGGDNTFLQSTGPLKAPLSLAEDYNNCPLHQAYLQLAFCRQMIVDHYPDVEIGPSYVAQVANDDTFYWPLPRAFIKAGPEIRNLVFLQKRLGVEPTSSSTSATTTTTTTTSSKRNTL